MWKPQTRKLMEVCRMRKTPVIVFVNKMDRDGKDPFDLLDEIEEELQIKVRPLSWPIDMGQRFKGVYNIYEQKLDLYTPSKQYVTEKIEFNDINSPELENHIGDTLAEKLRADIRVDRRRLSGVRCGYVSERGYRPCLFRLCPEQLRCEGVAGLLYQDCPVSPSYSGGGTCG